MEDGSSNFLRSIGTRKYLPNVLLKFYIEDCRHIYETISMFSYTDPVECLFYVRS